MTAPLFVLGASADGADVLAASLREVAGAAPVAVSDVDADGARALARTPGARLVAPSPWLARTGAGEGPWTAVDLAALLAAPADGMRALCAALGIAYDQAALGPVEDAARLAAGRDGDTAFASTYTPSMAAALRALGGALLVSTYQSGRLVCLRATDDGLNTHFRPVDKPMGIAVGPGRFSLGTRTEIWDLRDVPGIAAHLDPPGAHDACFLPRHRHVTGDVAVHEMGFAGGELWLVATAFSCLATLDADHSIVPRWTPPWISAVAAGDRCHLNGMCVVDDRVRYVTALGRTDEPRGWHAGKATGGVLYDVVAEEVVAAGLSMPHSPRVWDDRLWVLQSGLGALGVVDPADGTVEVVCELPGFTRGLTIVGGYAFVGLSQIRETSTFGDLPVVQRLDERQSGVWMVDLRSGAIAGFLRFEDLVQEVFDVALLPGTRYPEIADPSSTAVARTVQLP
ncbi:TIGR03032 family protein [Conexibacter sp. W3-3-2]|uniref:TIGR03032 family protein n=1 Tax=Conexibacter sp. W3-3-2 TaxID=2675227 RepID=UPI0012B97E18|nr:TIGR03032 family protein [Conexibacter sp. W3-3-2]MTD44752.1 TIGR03032 family protein [Conexibacter sp. W3-3-2]